MSPNLWNQVGELAQEFGYKDQRGRHSAVIREIVGGGTAMWRHSPYVCRSAHHTVFVTKDGDIFSRYVQVLQLNTPRQKLPCSVEMKPEKRDYYHRMYRENNPPPKRGRKAEEPRDEFGWFLSKWLFNHFAVWGGKKEPDDLAAFQMQPLGRHVDTFGTTYKSADLPVHAVGGRFLTREVIVGLRDYVQWKEPGTSIFDRVETLIDIPTTNLEVNVLVDQALFSLLGIEGDEISNLTLEFRNREAALFEGKDVARSSEMEPETLSGRSATDEGADEVMRKVRRLRQRVDAILTGPSLGGLEGVTHANRDEIGRCLGLPSDFLFYRLRWPFPQLGIEACVRWEKPLKRKS